MAPIVIIEVILDETDEPLSRCGEILRQPEVISVQIKGTDKVFRKSPDMQKVAVAILALIAAGHSDQLYARRIFTQCSQNGNSPSYKIISSLLAQMAELGWLELTDAPGHSGRGAPPKVYTITLEGRQALATLSTPG